MRVKTINPIDIQVSGGIDSLTVNDDLYMKINEYQYSNDFGTLIITGTYYYIDNGNEVTVKNFVKSFTAAEVDAMYSALTLPTFTTKTAFDEEVAYMAGKTVMATEYSNIETSNLEII